MTRDAQELADDIMDVVLPQGWRSIDFRVRMRDKIAVLLLTHNVEPGLPAVVAAEPREGDGERGNVASS